MDPIAKQVVENAVPAPQHFVAYTAFPGLEEAAERQLGARSKLLLPRRHQETFVRFLPWIALLFLPLHFAAVLLLLGISAMAAIVGVVSLPIALLSVVVFVLSVMALPGLFGRARRGWAFYLYAQLVGAVASLVNLSLLGVLVSAALIWLAFQVKYHYA